MRYEKDSNSHYGLEDEDGPSDEEYRQPLIQESPTFWLPWITWKYCHGSHIKYTNSNDS